MRKLILVTLLIPIAATVFSQKMISGVVKATNGEPVGFASLSFYSVIDTTTPQAEKIANGSGLYFVQLKDTGSYIIKVSATAARDTTLQVFVTNQVTKLDVVLRQNTHNLQDVVVSSKATPPIIQRTIDRVILNIENNALAAGKSALDLFKLAPGVLINNGEISISGIWGTRVMINGKMLHLTADDLKNYLQNLRSSDIKSIEIIAHPPAEYDAEGAGGLINIILKKHTQEGLNGYIGADYSIGLGKYPDYNPYLGLNYKKDKLQLKTTYSYNQFKNYQLLWQTKPSTDKGVYRSHSEAIRHRNAHNILASATYDLTNKSYLGLSYTAQFVQFNNRNTSIIDITYPNNKANNNTSTGIFPSKSTTKYADLGFNYHITIDTAGSAFTLLADYTHNNKNSHSGTFLENYDEQNHLLNDTSYYFNNPSTAKIYTVDAQYNKIFQSGPQLTLGAKATKTHISNGNSYEIFDGANFTPDPTQDFNYLYQENVMAGFINIAGQWLNVDYKIGFRGESSRISGHLTGGKQDKTIDQKYFSLFPDLFFQKSLDKDGLHALSIAINRRMNRPSYSELNPYKFYIDNYSVNMGNPYLRAQFTNSYELSYTFKKKFYFALTYARTTDVINQIIQTNPNNNYMIISRQNAGNSSIYSATISLPVKIAKWWTTSNNLVLTYTKNIAPEFAIKKKSFIFQSQQQIDLSKTFSLNISTLYTPSVAKGNFVTSAIGDLGIGIQKKFFNKKLTAKAAISDLFYTNNFSATSYYNQTQLHVRQKDQTRLLTLSLIYNFDLGNPFNTHKLQSSSADEKSRL